MTNFKKITLSAWINIFLLTCIIIGYNIQHNYGVMLKTLALYGLSGSITNSLAITMIFHKIPGIIGSGIIEKNFESFKLKLKETLITHIFVSGLNITSWNISELASKIYDRLKMTNMSFLTQFISEKHLAMLLQEIDLSLMLNQAITAEQLDLFIEQQLNKLTPVQIKNLILHIIDEHLQWLVLWGAIFGALFGLISFWIIV
ncbi:hypothetical protein EBR43_08195 [bacterium]|jgi:uncharacterized membrane protein YheB (UPF0754 family)|nr:hypothetical protein [bacterium]NBW57749.1 hypothetical protein [bacterium]NBX71930.1 hypothetical protein [bacterium]